MASIQRLVLKLRGNPFVKPCPTWYQLNFRGWNTESICFLLINQGLGLQRLQRKGYQLLVQGDIVRLRGKVSPLVDLRNLCSYFLTWRKKKRSGPKAQVGPHLIWMGTPAKDFQRKAKRPGSLSITVLLQTSLGHFEGTSQMRKYHLHGAWTANGISWGLPQTTEVEATIALTRKSAQ